MKIYLFFFRKNFGSSKKSSTFAPANAKEIDVESITLGYGVMVTLQILVLPFLVRVRVPQLREDVSILTHPLAFYTILSLVTRLASWTEFLTPYLASRRLRYQFTVSVLRFMRSAISGFVRPSQMKRRI